MPGDAKLPRVRQVVGPADPIPFNLTVFKGGKSWQLPRRFVWFLLYHPVAKTFLGDWHSTISVGASLNLILSEWSKTMYVPDESVVPTLARITHYQVKILVEVELYFNHTFPPEHWAWLDCNSGWGGEVPKQSSSDLETQQEEPHLQGELPQEHLHHESPGSVHLSAERCDDW